jgi:DNA-binding NarL/FixJ family response regulator
MPFRGSRPWTDAEDKRLLRMYKDGYERRIIAEALGRPPKTITDRKRKLLADECQTG